MSTALIETLIAERDFEVEMERKRARRILERIRHDIAQLLGAEERWSIRPHEIRPLIQAMSEAQEAVAGIEAITRGLEPIKKQLAKERA